MNYYIFVASIVWPIIFVYPKNSAIFTIILFLINNVNIFLKTKKMVDSEYILLTGNLDGSTWSFGIASLRVLQNSAAWAFVCSVHLYSPFVKLLYIVYVSAFVYAVSEYVYIHYYKHWVLSYEILSDSADSSP